MARRVLGAEIDESARQHPARTRASAFRINVFSSSCVGDVDTECRGVGGVDNASGSSNVSNEPIGESKKL
jgi:hypothetical protein